MDKNYKWRIGYAKKCILSEVVMAFVNGGKNAAFVQLLEILNRFKQNEFNSEEFKGLTIIGFVVGCCLSSIVFEKYLKYPFGMNTTILIQHICGYAIWSA